MSGVRLVWDGKDAEVPRLRLPIQVIETVNSPRADRGTIFESHTYDEPGDYTVLVKVVDIFGNDTTTAVQVAIR